MATSQMINAKSAHLVNKWSKRIKMTESVIGPMNMERKAALANSLENTHNRLKVMENTQPGSIGQYKRYALDIVNAVVPNLIAYDICSVQAIDNRVGMINYISYEYGANKGQTKAGDMFASSLNMGASDPNYTTNQVDNEIIAEASKATITGNVQWTPVTAGTFYVSADGGSVTGQDDGNGNITGTGITSGTIDYTTGEYTITFASAPTDEPTATYSYNNEDAPISSVPEVNLKITSLPVVAQSRKMKAVYAFDAAYELEKELTKIA